MKQLQLFSIILLSIIAINCKNPAKTNPTETEKPLTLADRARTYTFENKKWSIYHYVTVNKDGTGTFTGNSQIAFDTRIGDPSSTNTTFNFVVTYQDYTIDFKNGTLTEPRPYYVWTLVK